MTRQAPGTVPCPPSRGLCSSLRLPNPTAARLARASGADRACLPPAANSRRRALKNPESQPLRTARMAYVGPCPALQNHSSTENDSQSANLAGGGRVRCEEGGKRRGLPEAHGASADILQWLPRRPPRLSGKDLDGGLFPAGAVFILLRFLPLPRSSGKPPSPAPASKDPLLPGAVAQTAESLCPRVQTKAALGPGREVAFPARTFPPFGSRGVGPGCPRPARRTPSALSLHIHTNNRTTPGASPAEATGDVTHVSKETPSPGHVVPRWKGPSRFHF